MFSQKEIEIVDLPVTNPKFNSFFLGPCSTPPARFMKINPVVPE